MSLEITDEKTHRFDDIYRAKVVNDGLVDSTNTEKLLDTEKRGRIQIRIEGVHSSTNAENIMDGIPDACLPWAEQCAPLMFGAFKTKGVGVSCVPAIGSFVYVFFLNGNFQKPVYFGAVLGSSDISPSLTKDNIVIKTPGGHQIIINDKTDEEKITISHVNGAKMVMNTFNDKSRISHIADVVKIDAEEIQLITKDGKGAGGHPLVTTQEVDSVTFGSSTYGVAKKIKMQ